MRNRVRKILQVASDTFEVFASLDGLLFRPSHLRDVGESDHDAIDPTVRRLIWQHPFEIDLIPAANSNLLFEGLPRFDHTLRLINQIGVVEPVGELVDGGDRYPGQECQRRKKSRA